MITIAPPTLPGSPDTDRIAILQALMSLIDNPTVEGPVSRCDFSGDALELLANAARRGDMQGAIREIVGCRNN